GLSYIDHARPGGRTYGSAIDGDRSVRVADHAAIDACVRYHDIAAVANHKQRNSVVCTTPRDLSQRGQLADFQVVLGGPADVVSGVRCERLIAPHARKRGKPVAHPAQVGSLELLRVSPT